MKKVIVITGGNSGLGKATADILSRKNTVVILGKNKKEVAKTAKEFKCGGVICDVTDAKQVKNAFAKIIKKHKKIDCIINCAGVWITGAIDENSPEDVKKTILANTYGPILMTHFVVPYMKKQGFGRIINVVSQAGVTAKAKRSVYYASKWGMTGFNKSIQLELLPHNIAVMGFYPGFFHTNIFKKAGDNKTDFSAAMPVGKVAKSLVSLVTLDSQLVINGIEVQSIKQI